MKRNRLKGFSAPFEVHGLNGHRAQSRCLPRELSICLHPFILIRPFKGLLSRLSTKLFLHSMCFSAPRQICLRYLCASRLQTQQHKSKEYNDAVQLDLIENTKTPYLKSRKTKVLVFIGYYRVAIRIIERQLYRTVDSSEYKSYYICQQSYARWN